jgi:hypothetical protein
VVLRRDDALPSDAGWLEDCELRERPDELRPIAGIPDRGVGVVLGLTCLPGGDGREHEADEQPGGDEQQQKDGVHHHPGTAGGRLRALLGPPLGLSHEHVPCPACTWGIRHTGPPSNHMTALYSSTRGHALIPASRIPAGLPASW